MKSRLTRLPNADTNCSSVNPGNSSRTRIASVPSGTPPGDGHGLLGHLRPWTDLRPWTRLDRHHLIPSTVGREDRTYMMMIIIPDVITMCQAELDQHKSQLGNGVVQVPVSGESGEPPIGFGLNGANVRCAPVVIPPARVSCRRAGHRLGCGPAGCHVGAAGSDGYRV